jgi:hypothetical protein
MLTVARTENTLKVWHMAPIDHLLKLNRTSTHISKLYIFHTIIIKQVPRKFSQYSDWLQAAQLRGQSLSPGRVKNFLFSMSYRMAMGPTQPPINGYWSLFP